MFDWVTGFYTVADSYQLSMGFDGHLASKLTQCNAHHQCTHPLRGTALLMK